ncbi:hypothetical protein IWX90DRAFT_282504 [Phyllosticta citrichinensis]|uniref:Uncharacterized protein n=1 Tax=Phyllosticta citrichinensis TaxID=1130410 RepID=A0ABR1XNR2_9PEZI
MRCADVQEVREGKNEDDVMSVCQQGNRGMDRRTDGRTGVKTSRGLCDVPNGPARAARCLGQSTSLMSWWIACVVIKRSKRSGTWAAGWVGPFLDQSRGACVGTSDRRAKKVQYTSASSQGQPHADLVDLPFQCGTGRPSAATDSVARWIRRAGGAVEQSHAHPSSYHALAATQFCRSKQAEVRMLLWIVCGVALACMREQKGRSERATRQQRVKKIKIQKCGRERGGQTTKNPCGTTWLMSTPNREAGRKSLRERQ